MGYPAKSHDFVGRGRATEWMDFRTCAEVNDMQSARTTRRVWGGNPNKYLTGGQMSEKRNLVHWSILALRDCKLPLTSVRHFFGKSQSEKFVVLCLLLVHQEPVLASCLSFSATTNSGSGCSAH